MNVYAARKIISGAVLLVTALAVVYVKNDIPPNLLSFMEVLYSAFVLGNLGEHVSNAVISSKQGN